MEKITLKKKHKKLIAVVAGLLVIIFAASYTVFIAPNLEKEEWVYKEIQVEKGDLTVGVTESGSLEYIPTSQKYDLDLGNNKNEEEEDEEEEIHRYLEVENIQVAVGERVREGDEILSFTKESIEGVRKLLKTEVSEAEVALAEAKSEYNLEVLDIEATYQKRLIEANMAATKRDGDAAQPAWDVQEYQLQITLLYEEIVNLNENWQTVETTRYNSCLQYNELHEKIKNIDDNVEYAKLHNDYLNAKESYENALKKQEEISKQIADTYEEIAEYEKKIESTHEKLEVTITEAEQEYDTTITAGELAASIRDTEIEKLMAEVESVEEDLEECRKRLSDFESFVGDGKIYAKEAGIITEIGYEEGDELIDSATMVSYTAAEDMKISVDVTQEDIVDLKVGDKVDIVFSAYEEEKYEGMISSIKTTSTSEYAATVSYEVVISIQGDTSKLYGGMTADVTFVTEKKEDIVYVSKTAVEKEGEKRFVYVKDDHGEMIKKEVATGVENAIYIEITEGLQKGDTVYAASKVSKKKEERNKRNSDSRQRTDMISEEMGDQILEGMNFSLPDGMDFPVPEGIDFPMPDGMNGERPDFGR